MTTIVKVRNEIRFIREDEKYWSVNINNKELTGYKGGIIQRFPKGARQDIDTFLQDSTNQNTIEYAMLSCLYVYYYSTEATSFVESMLNAGNTHFNWETGLNYVEQQYSTKELSKLVSFARSEFESKEISYTLNQLRKAYRAKELTKNHTKLVERYGQEVVVKAITKVGEENAAMWLYYTQNEEVKTLVTNCWVSQYTVESRAVDIIQWCKEMGVKPHKSSIITEYPIIERNYKAWQNRAATKIFVKTQNPNFAFSAYGYSAIVPTTIEELVEEGAEMRNCLGDYWLNHYGNNPQKRFKRGVVFIRKDIEPNKPFIDCDFYLSSMCIQQFLAKNNYRPNINEEPDLFKFKRALQEHLLAFATN